MSVIEELTRLHTTNPTVVTVGMFDGVHRGHQYLIDCLKKEAAHQGFLSGVITFTNHPRSVMLPKFNIPLLNTPEDRLQLIADQGVDLVVPLNFTLDLSYLSAKTFIEVLRDALNMRELVVGPDFAFGYQREGTTEVLARLGEEMGFGVKVVDPVKFDGLIVSSTAVRNRVQEGDMAGAAWMLTRPFSLSGLVVKGDQRGRQIGFPTANLDIQPDVTLPPDGTYATWVHADGVTYKSVTNIGVRPTFGSNSRQIETHIIDYDGDLYNTKIRVAFARKLREEVKFNAVDDLVNQLHEDVASAKTLLNEDESLLPPIW
ncbi:MAG: bifunctional riboflavin kinase/FAD synthetase [Chloroflexota bacterium]|nr:bifunctional riboflavin kinase/FAD synthetase [Chloroflexota bacterium]